MAKLSEDMLEEGRALLRAHNLDGFMTWLTRTRIIIDHDVVWSTYEKLLSADATDRAVQLFDATFPDMDPTRDILGVFTSLALALFTFLVLLGGVAALLWLLLYLLF